MTVYAARGGMSGFVRDGMVFGSDPASCVRRALLRHHGIEETPNAKSQLVFHVGHINEARWQTYFEKLGWRFEAEKQIEELITPSTAFMGHMDFCVEDPQVGTVVYELKSVTSVNTYKKVFKEGRYKLSNLAQCCNYMLSVETTRGRLCYTSYREIVDYKDILNYDTDMITEMIYDNEAVIENKIFEVSITAKGLIFVDDRDSGWTVQHLLDHRTMTAEALEQTKVFKDRPQTDTSDNICLFCPFSKVCNKKIVSGDQFINDSREVLSE